MARFIILFSLRRDQTYYERQEDLTDRICEMAAGDVWNGVNSVFVIRAGGTAQAIHADLSATARLNDKVDRLLVVDLDAREVVANEAEAEAEPVLRENLGF